MDKLTKVELELIITIQDARVSGFCVKGCRETAQRNGKDLKSLIKYGITVREALSFDDVFFNRLANNVVKRSRQNGKK